MSEKLLICDIDGVIADLEHRLHYIESKPVNWDGFFEACDGDTPIKPVIQFVREVSAIFKIAYITGRPNRVRDKTVAWLRQNGLPLQQWNDGALLLMRRDDDHRQDHLVKWELFREWIDPEAVFAVIEDRDQVVEMWRGRGLLCLQPQKGDF